MNDNQNHPRPDLNSMQAKYCMKCKRDVQKFIHQSQLSNGIIRFTGHCLICGEKSGAIPYLKDFSTLENIEIWFGKHKGKTLREVDQKDPGYLDWCLNNIDDEKLLAALVLYKRYKSKTPDIKVSADRWARLRYEVLRTYGYKCMACNRDRKDGIKLHVDHIKPVSTNPELQFDITNLQVLCDECNIGKSNRYDDDFRSNLYYLKHNKIERRNK